jgi:hypothetical protein
VVPCVIVNGKEPWTHESAADLQTSIQPLPAGRLTGSGLLTGGLLGGGEPGGALPTGGLTTGGLLGGVVGRVGTWTTNFELTNLTVAA